MLFGLERRAYKDGDYIVLGVIYEKDNKIFTVQKRAKIGWFPLVAERKAWEAVEKALEKEVKNE